MSTNKRVFNTEKSREAAEKSGVLKDWIPGQAGNDKGGLTYGRY
jgi:hypothetical protein